MRQCVLPRAAAAALLFLASLSFPSALQAASPQDIDTLIERVCAKAQERWTETPVLQTGEKPATTTEVTQCFGEFVDSGWWYMVRFEEHYTVSLLWGWTTKSREFSIVKIETDPFDAQASQPLLMQFMASRKAGHATLGLWSFYNGKGEGPETFILPPDPNEDDWDCAPGSWSDCTVVGEEHRKVWDERYAHAIALSLAKLP